MDAYRTEGFEPSFAIEGGEMDAMLGCVDAGTGVAVEHRREGQVPGHAALHEYFAEQRQRRQNRTAQLSERRLMPRAEYLDRGCSGCGGEVTLSSLY